MNLLNNRQLIISSSVFLLLVGFAYFAMQFFNQPDLKLFLVNELKQLNSNQVLTFGGMQSVEEQRIMAAANDLPSFKKKQQSSLENTFNFDIEFPGNNNLESIDKTKKSTILTNRVDKHSSNVATYSYPQNKTNVTYSAGEQNVSSKTFTIINNNTVSSNISGIQDLAYYGANSSSVSNRSSNIFIANNSLSLTTDLSDNNSPMMIDGDSNPGDPGIPVGDGTLILLVLGILFASIKQFQI